MTLDTEYFSGLRETTDPEVAALLLSHDVLLARVRTLEEMEHSHRGTMYDLRTALENVTASLRNFMVAPELNQDLRRAEELLANFWVRKPIEGSRE